MTKFQRTINILNPKEIFFVSRRNFNFKSLTYSLGKGGVIHWFKFPIFKK